MKNFIENRVLENTNFDLKTVGPFAYMIHKMSKEGKYFMEIYDKDRVIHKSEIDCSKEYSVTSENIDLNSIFSTTPLQTKFRLNNENGYLLFYNSKEFSNLKVIIKTEKSIEFDSLKPQKGDLYSVNLIKPGIYEVNSKSFKNPLKVDVAYPVLSVNRKTLEMDTLLVTSESKTDLVSQPNQGLVFQLDEKINDFSIRLLKENLPKKGETIEEQLKSRLSTLKVVKKANTRENPLRKYSKKFS